MNSSELLTKAQELGITIEVSQRILDTYDLDLDRAIHDFDERVAPSAVFSDEFNMHFLDRDENKLTYSIYFPEELNLTNQYNLNADDVLIKLRNAFKELDKH